MTRFRELRRLTGGGVEVLAGEFFVSFTIGGIVVEQVNALQQSGVLRHHERVGEVGVAARGIGWGSELVVWDYPTVCGGEIQSALDAWDGVIRDAVLLDAFAFDVAVAGLFLKKEPVARYAVIERKCGDLHEVILENHGRLLAVNRVDVDVEVPMLDKEVDLRLQNRLQIRRHVEM